MNRLHPTFACGRFTCAATLDCAPGHTGLLIVSGGNEIRSGAFGGQAALAANIAAAGFPVFRFDRRGIGDSDGENRGYRKSATDIAAALSAFRAMAPQMERVVAFGNCDAASALMLGSGFGCDALVLSNPWTIEDEAGEGSNATAAPPAALRTRYARKLANPREVLRLLRGGVDLRKLARGLGQAFGGAPTPSNLSQEMAAGLREFDGPVRIVLAGADRTAQLFEESWKSVGRATTAEIARCDGAGHAYVEPHAKEFLRQQLLEVLRG